MGWREEGMLPGFISCFSPPLNSQHLEQFSGFFGGSDRKESTCSAGDLGSVPGGGRSPGEWSSQHLASCVCVLSPFSHVWLFATQWQHSKTTCWMKEDTYCRLQIHRYILVVIITSHLELCFLSHWISLMQKAMILEWKYSAWESERTWFSWSHWPDPVTLR